MSKIAKLTRIKKLFAFASNEFANPNIVGSNDRKVVAVMVKTKGERFKVILSILSGRRGHVGGNDPPLWQHLPVRGFDTHWISGIELVNKAEILSTCHL